MLDPSGERGVAPRMYPLSAVGCDSDTLNLNIEAVGAVLENP